METSSKLRTLRNFVNLPSGYQRANSEKIGSGKWIDQPFCFGGSFCKSLQYWLLVQRTLEEILLTDSAKSPSQYVTK